MENESIQETINEATKALLEAFKSPSIGDQSTITIGIYDTKEYRDDLGMRIKSAIKKDRFSFADKFVGRGRGSARNQQFSQHFKK